MKELNYDEMLSVEGGFTRLTLRNLATKSNGAYAAGQADAVGGRATRTKLLLITKDTSRFSFSGGCGFAFVLK